MTSFPLDQRTLLLMVRTFVAHLKERVAHASGPADFGTLPFGLDFDDFAKSLAHEVELEQRDMKAMQLDQANPQEILAAIRDELQKLIDAAEKPNGTSKN